MFCRCIERLYQHIFAKLYFATANNEIYIYIKCSYLKIFEHLVLNLTNSQLFQQNLMPALRNNDVTVT